MCNLFPLWVFLSLWSLICIWKLQCINWCQYVVPVIVWLVSFFFSSIFYGTSPSLSPTHLHSLSPLTHPLSLSFSIFYLPLFPLLLPYLLFAFFHFPFPLMLAIFVILVCCVCGTTHGMLDKWTRNKIRPSNKDPNEIKTIYDYSGV